MRIPAKLAPERLDYAISLAILTVCTLFAIAVRDETAIGNSAIFYLLGVLVVSVRCRRPVAIFNVVVSVLAFHYFCVPQFDRLRPKDYDDLLTLMGMLLVALVTSTQTAKIRGQAREAIDRERKTAALYALSQELSAANTVPEVVQSAVRIAAKVFEAEVRIFVPGEYGSIDGASGASTADPASQEKVQIAQHVLDTGETHLEPPRCYVPLVCAGTPLAVMSLMPYPATPEPRSDSSPFFEIFCAQIATAIERSRSRAAAHDAEVAIQAERTRNALLSAVSHDLKTPLASIYGSATSLLLDGQRLDIAAGRDLIKSIADESERMNQLIVNLLEMTRLEAGGQARREWYPLEEIVGAALTRLEQALAGRPVTTDIPDDLPLVYADGVLLQQVFVNLLDNAIKHTQSGTPIHIEAKAEAGKISVGVRDRGAGFTPGDESRVFEKFFRGQPARSRGAGLGLAICRAIVEAHGGVIVARNADSGGATICFELPLGGVPPRMGISPDVVSHE